MNTDARLARRRLLVGGAGVIAVVTCVSKVVPEKGWTSMARRFRREGGEGRLLSRPGQQTGSISPGLHSLGPEGGGDAILYVPTGYRPEVPAPFVLSLHGAGGNERSGLYPLQELADKAGLILLAPSSRGRTWDVILGGFGPDIDAIDHVLAAAFACCVVDPARVAVAGFSDGASYALSIGISNGDLFPSVMAFSPGFAAPRRQHGEPRFFISHGTGDAVLPIDRTSRRVAPQLEEAGFDVRYREFEGSHTVPPEIAREAVSWFLAESGDPVATPVR